MSKLAVAGAVILLDRRTDRSPAACDRQEHDRPTGTGSIAAASRLVGECAWPQAACRL